MSWIQKTYSTLQTWVFKKKLLQFSSNFERDPQSCFYCPELCRFSCPVSETLRSDTVTPRGKMSLLHLSERGFSNVTGSDTERLWFLEQCTGCGLCTEHCLHEVDVASNLRNARQEQFSRESNFDIKSLIQKLEKLSGVVFFVEPSRATWWNKNHSVLNRIDEALQESAVVDLQLPHSEWSWGLLSQNQILELSKALKYCRRIWVESPEDGLFLSSALKSCGLQAEVRLLWQRFFADYASLEQPPGVLFHESYHLTRLLPRIGVSIPMYERGILPFHHGWKVQDCGGEGFYRFAHRKVADEMAKRFLVSSTMDGRKIDRIVCQNLSCLEHLSENTEIPIKYWLDELLGACL